MDANADGLKALIGLKNNACIVEEGGLKVFKLNIGKKTLTHRTRVFKSARSIF
jgi:hypothetical protein